MLTQYADGLIIPGYSTLQEKIAALRIASDAFIAAPSLTTQDALKAAYTETHLQYERVAGFQFGPAETALLDLYLNYSGGLDYSFTTAGELTGFSVDTAKIESNISAGSYDLTAMQRSTFYSQGFAALNYLYFGPDAINKLSASPARAKYIRDVVDRMKTLVDKVAAEWPAYRAAFIANTKTNVGSPIGNMVNQLAYQLDLLKGPRIGWPMGKQSNGIAFPTKCEAYYANISRTLAVENLTAAKRIYTGTAGGKGLSDYLVSLKQAELNHDLLAQFDLAIAKLSAIPDPLSTSFTAHPADVDAAYKEIQKLLTLLKTDVASATAVQITFMDNDGD
jgi:predicted lipoprotein